MNCGRLEGLQADLCRRILWFHECHLRRLNFESFRASAKTNKNGKSFWKDDKGKALDGLPEPEWSETEREQRDAFAAEAIGQISDWVGQQRPTALLAKLAEAKTAILTDLGRLETSAFSTDWPRKDARSPFDHDGLFHAISRMEISRQQPWLIPDLFGWTADRFVALEDEEIRDLFRTREDQYINAESKTETRSLGKSVRVEFLASDGKHYTPRVWTRRKAAFDIVAFPTPEETAYEKARYWVRACEGEIREVFYVKENSDMGLTHLVRLLYLYGTLPSNWPAAEITWRTRALTLEQQKLFATHVDERKKNKSEDEARKIDESYMRLMKALNKNAQDIGSCDLRFSFIAESVIKRAILGYKFWLDEPFHCLANERLNTAREAHKYSKDQELQFWSENHYIMFASAEYLCGQLWEREEFQAGPNFLAPDQADLGKMNGARRRERGKWRLLKWLNNRLAFGWTEFNSPGYYREHFEPLSNLVDFARDAEIRKKAKMVMDLLLFDIARFTHKGSFGVVGGRAQFKSKHSGWDNAIGDLTELAFGTRGAFVNRECAIGGCFATSVYKVPDVLLEIAIHPPKTPFVDRSRVSIDFAEAPRYGIGYSQTSRQRESIESGYQPKLRRRCPHVQKVNDGIKASHFDYGKREDDTVFWWTLSAFYTKQIVEDSLDLAERWGFNQTEPWDSVEKLFGSTMSPVDNVLLGTLGWAAGSSVGSALGPIGTIGGAVVGGALGFKAGGKFISLRSAMAWGKLGLLGLSMALGPFGLVFAIVKLGNPFSSEQHADDISIMVEGSVRSRANIYVYRSNDAMLSSVQNFRPGQLNFQSNVSMATLSTGASVFTTSAYKGVEIPTLFAGLGGGLLLGPLGAGAAMIYNAAELKGDDLAGLVKHEDGPGWWTGYWALPMVVQHGSAAILLYDFHWIQRQMTDCATHVWLPEKAFATLEDDVEPNPDTFDDTQSPIEDVTEFFSDTFGEENGRWIFGRVVHHEDADHPEANEEAYIGVFTNARLEELDEEDDFYEDLLKQKNKKALEKIEKEIGDKAEGLADDDKDEDAVRAIGERLAKEGGREAVKAKARIDSDEWVRGHVDGVADLAELLNKESHHKQVWEKKGPDYFVNHDRHSDGKNIFVIQIGSQAEFGSYESFKDRVRNTTLEVDTTGDMECKYDIPLPDGSSKTLEVHYEDGGEFSLGGSGYTVDRYPRFENEKFIRGTTTEWGQREYAIEYNGKNLVHRFWNYEDPWWQENVTFSADEIRQVKAFAIYVQTENEDMDIFSVARARVSIDCVDVVAGEIVAVGEVDDDTSHDVEWIFLDSPVPISPEMSIELTHPPVERTGNDDPHWRMSFGLKALMGDGTLQECTVALHLSKIAERTGEKLAKDYGAAQVYRHTHQVNFEDQERASGPIPFSVKLRKWRDWRSVEDLSRFTHVTMARQGGPTYPYTAMHVAGLDSDGHTWIGRYQPCSSTISWTLIDPATTFPSNARITTIEPSPDHVFAFAVRLGGLHVLARAPNQPWQDTRWERVGLQVFIGGPMPPPVLVDFAISPDARIEVVSTELYTNVGLQLLVHGPDGQIYVANWKPGDTPPVWQPVKVDDAMVMSGQIEFASANGFLFVLDETGNLWAARLGALSVTLLSTWALVVPGGPGLLRRPAGLTAIAVDGVLTKLFVISSGNQAWSADIFGIDSATEWTRVGGAFAVAPSTALTCVASELHTLHLLSVSGSGVPSAKRWSVNEGWDGGEAWEAIASQQRLKESGAAIWAMSRTDGQIEAFFYVNGQLASAWWS